jgi:uncharacterized membrane protein
MTPQFGSLLAHYRLFSIVARRMTRSTTCKKGFNNYSESVQHRPQSLFNIVPYSQLRSWTFVDVNQQRTGGGAAMHQWSAGAWGPADWPWPDLLWLIAFLLFWGGLLALLIWAVRLSAGSRRDDRETTDEILRRRLANGDISPEEYEHIRSILRD